MKYNSKIVSLMIILIFATLLVLQGVGTVYAVDPNSGGPTQASPIGDGGPYSSSQGTSSTPQGNSGNQGGSGSQGTTGSGSTSEAPLAIKLKLKEINTVLFTLACVVCVIKAVQIGIMFMLNGAGTKGQAKSAILPWIIGAVVCGSYALIAEKVITLIESSAGGGGVLEPGNANAVVNSLGGMILSCMMYFAYATAFAVILIIGIKYMTGAAGDKAKVKSTFVPYLVGAIIVGAASQLAIYVMGLGGGNG